MKKLKLCFSGILGWLLLVGCDTAVRVIDDLNEPESEPTYATFALNIKNPETYAGTSEEIGVDGENTIKDALLIIYKMDGTPEVMGYVATAEILTESQENSEATARITLKCKSGEKLIYMATNVGGNKLIYAGQGTYTNIFQCISIGSLKLENGRIVALPKTGRSLLKWLFFT
jgi:hypothetical protein